MIVFTTGTGHLLCCSSQRSLHNAPIFRLLLKVAVNGTHQCDCPNFCGAVAPIATSVGQALGELGGWASCCVVKRSRAVHESYLFEQT